MNDDYSNDYKAGVMMKVVISTVGTTLLVSTGLILTTTTILPVIEMGGIMIIAKTMMIQMIIISEMGKWMVLE